MKNALRYGDIRPMFLQHRIREFSHIFKVLPPTMVAEDLGKAKDRILKLIKTPGDFRIRDMIGLSERCCLSLTEMATLLTSADLRTDQMDVSKKDERYTQIKPLFDEKKIKTIDDIVGRVKSSNVAKDLGKKRDQFKEWMADIELFFVRDIARLGKLCELTIVEMFQLVDAQHKKQWKKKNKHP